MFDVDTLVAECREAVTEATPHLAIKELLERAVSDPAEVARALPPDQAGIEPLHVSPDLGDDAIHAVTNPTREFTGAIHIYGGDFFSTPRSEWDGSPYEERPFDVDRVRATFETANEEYFADHPDQRPA